MPEKDGSVSIGSPKLSIVIVSWNTCDKLIDCLISIYRFLPIDLAVEILVVDNASNDHTAAIVRVKYSDILYIQNKSNVGFSVANNVGIRHARGRYVLLLNPDTLFVEDCVTPLLRLMDADDSIGLMACRLDNLDRTLQWSADVFPIPLHEINLLFQASRRRLLAQIQEAVKNRSSCEVGCVTGAFQILPRDLLVRVGMMDENLFMYGEDLDLCLRIKNTGKKIIYDASVSLIHLGGQSAGQIWSDETRMCRVRESLFRIHCKRFGIVPAVLSLGVRVMLAWLRWLAACATFSTAAKKQDYLTEAAANVHTFSHMPELVRGMKLK